MPERKSPNKVKLSPLTVAKARPKARAYLIWDVLQAGLAVRVQPSGYSSFVMVYRSRGRPRWFFIGPTNAVSLANARALAAETMLRVLKGEDPAAERRAGRQAATFGVLANRYLEEHAKLRNKSWRQAAHLINRHVLP